MLNYRTDNALDVLVVRKQSDYAVVV